MKNENEIGDETPETTSINTPPPSLLQNYISFIGIAIAAASLTSFGLLLLVGLSSSDNPYTDLITFIFVPSVLVFGLFVTLAGALWERRRRRLRSHDEVPAYPILDLNDPRRRRLMVAFMCISFIF